MTGAVAGAAVVEFRLPDVGEGLDEAEIVDWLVAEGAQVARDQPLVEILTDKAQVELPSPVAGRVVRLAVPAGERVKVGTLLVELAAADGPARPAPGADTPASAPPNASVSPAAPAPPALSVAVDSPSGPAVEATANRRSTRRAKASPSTRRLAAARGIDLATVTGTGPGGRILATDLDAPRDAPVAAPPAPLIQPGTPSPAARGPSPVAYGVQPLRGIRRLTAEAMARAWSEIPHITGMDEVDATALLEARAALRDRLGPHGATLTPLALLALAVLRALRRHPLVNASLDTTAGTITVHERINLGIAVATDAGLVVPVVTDADRRGLVGLADEIARLATAARDRTVTPAELRGGTFTITNYGALGGRFATPIIRPGEVGIMGFGAIRPRPAVVGDEVRPRPTLPVVFSADHRLIDGDLATAFQEDVIATVREPLTLLADG